MGAPPPPPVGTGRRLVAAAALVVAHVVAAALLVAAAIQAALTRRAPRRRRASGVVFRATETAAVDTVVRPLVRAHGADTVAHASANGSEFSHYVVPGAGSIAFAVATGAGRRVPMALGDPLAPRASWPAVVDGFLADVAERDCGVPREHVTFWHASPAFAEWLAGRYDFLRADAFGAETRLDIQAWAHTTRTRTLRRDARQARDAGVVVYEATAADLDAPGARAALAALSAAWRAGKAVSDRPLRAFCRSPDWASLRLGDDAGGRLFVAVLKGAAKEERPAITAASLAGVVLLDPLWAAGAVTGYFPTLNQMAPWAHQGTLKAAYECVLAELKKEGVATLNLGFAPAFAVASDSARLPTARPTAWAGPLTAAAYTHGNALYAFTALAASKTRWAGASFDAARGAFGAKAGAALSHVYIVHGRAAPTPLAAVDLMLCLRWLGFWDTLAGAVGQVAGVDLPKWVLSLGAAAADDQGTRVAVPAPAPAPVPAAKEVAKAAAPPPAAASLARLSPLSVLDAPPSRPTTPYEAAGASIAAAVVNAVVPSPFAAAAAQAAGAKLGGLGERLSPVSSLFAAPSLESDLSATSMERALSPPLEPGTPPALAAAAAAVVGAREE